MAIPARKAAIPLAVLGALTAGLWLWHTAPNFPPKTPALPPSTHPRATTPVPNESVESAAPDPSALPPARSATSQSPSPLSAGSTISPATLEASLPPPPSGDYDLTLTPSQIDAIVETRYQGLFQSLDLSSEQLARLHALLAERQQVTVDAANAALFFGLNPVRELSAIRDAVEQFQAGIDTTLRGEFGEAVFAAYREFDSTVRERNSAGDFARLLAAAREPLRSGQEKQVVQILKNFPGWDPPPDLDRVIYGGIKDRARISDQAVAAAATTLSPRQLELLRELQQRWAAEDVRRWPNEKRTP